MAIGNVRQWHWVSSAICLVGLLLFAVTGFTLNHAGWIEGQVHITEVEQSLPDELHPILDLSLEQQRLDSELIRFVQEATQHRLTRKQLESAQWSPDELYLSLPRPGGDAWLVLDTIDYSLLFEQTERGWVAYLNDLHKGRHTNLAWSLFIDAVALCCVIFAVTGLWLLIRQQKQRRMTWPLTTLGFLIPVIVLLLHAY